MNQKCSGSRAAPGDHDRQRIAKAAKELFLQRGFAATTIEEIAAAADFSRRSFRDYFPAKEDVLGWHDEFQSAFVANHSRRPGGETYGRPIETPGNYPWGRPPQDQLANWLTTASLKN
jgi:hypothetical protein